MTASVAPRAATHIEHPAAAHGQLTPHGWPLAACVAAGLVMTIAPTLVGYLRTGGWLCLRHVDSLFYLQIASTAYYGDHWYASDPAVPGGFMYYTWLQIVPAAKLARALSLSPFSVSIIWQSWASVGMAAGAYFLFWRLLRRRWMAAACAIFFLADAGFGKAHPLIEQVRLLAQALATASGTLATEFSLPFWHWRILNPALDLPFVLFQIGMVSVARERPTRLNTVLSGAALGALFYMYFYAWTMVALGLCIAVALDRRGRALYAKSLAIGFAIGLPELLRDVLIQHATFPGVQLGLLASVPRTTQFAVPRLGALLFVAVSIWVWRKRDAARVYLWGVIAAGVLLSRSSVLTGLYLHEYHWNWFWLPLVSMLLLALIADAIPRSLIERGRVIVACWIGLTIYLALGASLIAACVVRMEASSAMLADYQRYRVQRLTSGVRPLVPGSTVGGWGNFADLATVGENQIPLGGYPLQCSVAAPLSTVADRFALDAYLYGESRDAFVREIRSTEGWYWYARELHRQFIEECIRAFDEIETAPPKFIERYHVRYVAIPVAEPSPAYLSNGWGLLQSGPYWRIYEWKAAADELRQDAATAARNCGSCPDVAQWNPNATAKAGRRCRF